ncbi:hypothetical protein BD309DRAFT_975487 [Dichomitus squalens]|nr:hypothetical protein BD309DRAFT_975487 [Dichomitus squalens]
MYSCVEQCGVVHRLHHHGGGGKQVLFDAHFLYGALLVCIALSRLVSSHVSTSIAFSVSLLSFNTHSPQSK